MALKHPLVKFLQVDVDDLPDISSHCKRLPTIEFFVRGSKVNQIIGSDTAAIEAMIFKYANEMQIKNVLSSIINSDDDDKASQSALGAMPLSIRSGPSSDESSGYRASNADDMSDMDAGLARGPMHAPAPPPRELAHEYKRETKVQVQTQKKNDGRDNSAMVWAALEQACNELGYSLDKLHEMLESQAFDKKLLDLVMLKIGESDPMKVIDMLEPQRPAVLARVKKLIGQRTKVKSEEEKKIQVRRMVS